MLLLICTRSHVPAWLCCFLRLKHYMSVYSSNVGLHKSDTHHSRSVPALYGYPYVGPQHFQRFKFISRFCKKLSNPSFVPHLTICSADVPDVHDTPAVVRIPKGVFLYPIPSTLRTHRTSQDLFFGWAGHFYFSLFRFDHFHLRRLHSAKGSVIF